MKKQKILTALGSISVLAIPATTVISCATSGNNTEDPMIAIENFINGSVPTIYVPQDNTKWYDFIVDKRVHSYSGKGQTIFGLWDRVQNNNYEYGTFADSISSEFGFLQNGKLLMTSHYHKNNITDTNDIREPLSIVGDVLQATLTKLQNDASQFTDFVGSDADTIKAAIKAISVDNIIESSPENLTRLDYLGFKTLAPIFNNDKYIDAAPGSEEETNKNLTTNFVNMWFIDFQWDLHEKLRTVTKDESIAIGFAWQSVYGRTWDVNSSKLGDTKNLTQTLVKPWMRKPTPVDHNLLIGNMRQDGNHPDTSTMTAAAGGVQVYSNQAFRFTGNLFNESTSSMAEILNELGAKGIIPVDTGYARYNVDGEVISGEETVRKLKFGLFESITLNDGSTDHVFDNDNDSKTDNKSINGDEFLNVLSSGNLKTFKVKVKDGAKWINSKGQTQGSVVAEDFWYGIQRKNYDLPGIRHSVEASGGVQNPPEDKQDGFKNSIATALENHFNGQNTNKSSFQTPSKQESSQQSWYETTFKNRFGMKPISKGESQHASIVDKADNSLTFEVDDPSERKMNLFWKELFASPSKDNLKALPSQKIMEQQYTAYKNIVPKADFSKPIFKYGVYYDNVAKNIDDFHFAGRYYTESNKASRIIFKLNPNEANLDKDTSADANKRVKSITYRFVDQGGTPSIQIEEAYNKDTIYQAAINSQETKGWRDKIYKMTEIEREKYGLTYSKTTSSIGDVGERFYSPALPFDTVSPTSGEYFYNDNMAKMLYGDTVKNLWKADSVEEMIKHFYEGNGLIFRSTIQTTLNAFGIVHDLNPGMQDNLSLFAPQGVIPGTGTTAAKAVNESRLFSKYAFGKNLVEIDEAHYRDSAIEAGYGSFVISDYFYGTNQKPIKTDYLTKLKENMKIVLDDEGIGSDEFVISEVPLNYIRGIDGIAMARYLEHLRYAYNILDDKRLKFVANVHSAELLK